MLFEAIGTAEVWSTYSERLRLSHPPCSTKAYRVLVSPSSVSPSFRSIETGSTCRCERSIISFYPIQGPMLISPEAIAPLQKALLKQGR